MLAGKNERSWDCADFLKWHILVIGTFGRSRAVTWRFIGFQLWMNRITGGLQFLFVHDATLAFVLPRFSHSDITSSGDAEAVWFPALGD